MAKTTTNYKALQQELDTIVGNLQQNDLDIEVAIKDYERGMAIVKELETYLEKAENTITKLKSTFESK